MKSQSGSANARRQQPQKSVIVMGGSGTGKTTFVNLVSESQFVVGEGLESCTNAVQSHKFLFEGDEVTLIDVPGFDDTTKSDIDLLQLITDFLVSEYKANHLLTGVLYFHRISDVRMGGTAKRNLTMFQKLCGSDAFKNVAIVTTRWDKEEESVALARYNELSTKPHLFQPILEGGGRMFRHDRGAQSAREIIRHLGNCNPAPLLIQSEIVNEHKHLLETAAGAELHRDIIEQVEIHQKELTELIEEMERSDGSDTDDLENECQELRARMAHWYTEAEKFSSTGARRSQTEGETGNSNLEPSDFASCEPQLSAAAPESDVSGSTLTSSRTSNPFRPPKTSSNKATDTPQGGSAVIRARREGQDREVIKRRIRVLTQRIQATLKHVSDEVKSIFAYL